MTSAGQGLIVIHSKLKSDMRSELPSPLLLNIVTRWKHTNGTSLLVQL